MQVGTVGAGRIGWAVLRRLKPFEVGQHYTDRHRLPAAVEQELDAREIAYPFELTSPELTRGEPVLRRAVPR